MGAILACSLYPESNARTLTSRYAITSKHLGKGAFAVVREGVELDTEMPVAVKIIQKKGSNELHLHISSISIHVLLHGRIEEQC